MRNIVMVVMCAALITAAHAAGTTAKCFWNAVTTYVDGSALPATDIAHYTLTWAPAAGQNGPSGSLNIPAGILSAPVTIACGATTFTISVTTTATARVPNSTSAPSAGIAYDSKVPCAPSAPSGLIAQ